MKNLINEAYNRMRVVYRPMLNDASADSSQELHTIEKSRRIIVAGHDKNELAKTSAIALPNSMLIPQGLLAYDIACGVLYNRLSQDSYENEWVKWASESTNNLAWLFLFSYHCLVTTSKTSALSRYISGGFHDTYAKFDGIKERAWNRYRVINNLNTLIESGALNRNTKLHDFLVDNSVSGYTSELRETYALPRIKKRTKLSPMPRVLENADMFFGTHTKQVFARIITEEIVGENFDAHYVSRSSARCNAKLIKYYSDMKKNNPSLNLLDV